MPAGQVPITRAVLLAAGRGSRLGPLTDDRPKPMLVVGGRPLIEHTVLQLAALGVREIAINLHHQPDVVRRHFGNGRAHGVRIEYSYEPELLGTAGAVRQVAAWIGGEAFFVVYGDNLTTCNLARLADTHAANGALVTIALFWKQDVTPHSAVELQPDDRIVRFVEKPTPKQAPSHWISAGVTVMEPGVLDCIPAGRPSDFGFDVFPGLIERGHRVQGYRMGPAEGLWGIDTPQSYARVCELWKSGHPPI